jgi:ribosomal protein S18 acetylase RimI-like enzyme
MSRDSTASIREARADDIERIARLHAESWRVAYRGMYSDAYLDGDVFADRLQVWQERLGSPKPNQYVIVAEDGGNIAGFACAYGDDDPKWGTLLDNLHVHPEGKRRGVGTQLIAAAAHWSAREYPASGFYLWVLEGNAPARRFYERHGAQNVEMQESTPAGGGTIRGLRYAWPSLAPLLST